MNAISTCISCDANDWKYVTTLPAFLFGIQARISRCKKCGLGITDSPPEISLSHYQDNERYDELFDRKAVLYRGFAQQLLGNLSGIMEPQDRSLLDIACGGGFVVEVAGDMGFAATGLEANANVVQACQRRGLDVLQGDIQSLPQQPKKYDVIVLSAILEHLPEPGLLLHHCHALLKTDGIVLISQASFDGLLPRVFPWGWYGWQPQEHFWHFTPGSLTALANKQGYNVRQCKRGSLYHPWFTRGSIKELVGRNVAAMLARIGDALHRGDSFNMILSKQN